jgi:prepilin-type N-terminal cleavage/methylation domain-containing protein
MAKAQSGFTLVEIMIVVGILGIILAIAAPTWMRQRMVSQQRVCQENLTKLDGAKEEWALANRMPGDSEPSMDDLIEADGTGYLKVEPFCPASGEYTLGTVNEAASCSVVAPLDHNELP